MRRGSEYILCFDARQSSIRSEAYWSNERRQAYLYRLDIKAAMSTDRYVLDTLDSRYYDADSVGYTGPFSPFWESLSQLQSFVDSLELSVKDYFLISISLDISLLTTSDLEYWSRLLGREKQPLSKSKLFESLATPNRVQEDWDYFGYDVADSGFTNAISNMGFTSDDDVPSLRAKWGPCLNEHHLFDQAEYAVNFKEFSNQRVPEHAPFSVIWLWCVS